MRPRAGGAQAVVNPVCLGSARSSRLRRRRALFYEAEMARLSDQTDDSEAGDSDKVEAKPRPSRRKLIILAAAAAVVLVLGGGGAAFYFGLFGGSRAGVTAGATAQTPTFFVLPDLVVTLNAGERRTRYLKARVSLELATAGDVPQLELVVPRIVDYCQTYLRELRPDELRGSAAIVRMRAELLKRVNAAVTPVVVREVLFTDLMVE